MLSFLENINTQFLGKNYCYFNEISSTNDFLMKQYKGPFNEGFLVVAGNQTSGRGREDRVWVSKKNNSLVFSLILTPKKHQAHIPQLTQTIALAISQVLEQYCSLSTQIKWPNDIYINDKKICGILCESKNENERFLVIAGVGLNVNQELQDFPDELKSIASSLKMESKKSWDLEMLLSKILYKIEEQYIRWSDGKFLEITEDISLRFYLKNKELEIHTREQVIYGRALGINEQGYLLVEDRKNQVHTILSGEIRICS